MAEKGKALSKGSKVPKEPPPREPVREKASPGPSREVRSSPRRRAEGGERLTAYLPPDLKVALEIRCAKERRSISDAVTEALETWMKTGAK